MTVALDDADVVLRLADPAATHAAGVALGRAARPGDVIAAVGPLGAGKTSLAQGVARGLAVPDEHYVNSPTFAILQVHPGRVPFYHIDLYRIGDPDEALGLGLEEAVGTDGVAFVEWPSQLPELLPPDVLWVKITPEGTGRHLICRPTGARAHALMASAFADARPAKHDPLANT